MGSTSSEDNGVSAEQLSVCRQWSAACVPSPLHLKVGISQTVRDGMLPINGLRHPPTGDTTGWYIWAGGEPPDDPEFFQPLHVEHLDDWFPGISRFLGLAPGWRFLIDGNGYEDVWEDRSLLEI